VLQKLRPILKDLIPEVILSYKCQLHPRLIRNCYWVSSSWIVGDASIYVIVITHMELSKVTTNTDFPWTCSVVPMVTSSLDRSPSRNIDGWYLIQHFATWTASPLTKHSSTNMTSHVQHDAAPPHFNQIVTHYLNQQFPTRWIGRGSAQKWPPRSPDLNLLDHQVWGYMKAKVCLRKVKMRDELFRRVPSAARRINNAAVLRKVICSLITWVGKCIQADTGHFEQLEWVVKYVTVTV
jgi:hypothetical protein